MSVAEGFLRALHAKKKVVITYTARDGAERTRSCAPLDYGPSRRAQDGQDRFHVWDFDGSAGPHVTSLLPEQIEALELTNEPFDPADFVTWSPEWIVPRDWGKMS